MGLRINSVVGKLPKIIAGILLVLVASALIKVAIWEQYYYLSKEGSPRTGDQSLTPEEILEEGTVDETEISPAQILEHQVAADHPRYLSIPKLAIKNARIFGVGLTSQNKIGTLANIYDIAWYTGSSLPGQGGTAIMNAHNGGPTKIGVFKYLDNLKIGDKIIVERGDGKILNYEVFENKLLRLEDANKYMHTMQKSPIEGLESLSLITCSGDWSQMARTYTSRSMLRATLIEETENTQ